MEYYIELALYFAFAYLVTFLGYFIMLRKKKRKKELAEMTYIIEKFKLERNTKLLNKLKWILNFINPFIISIAFIIIINVKSLVLGAMIGFVIMVLLVYAIYEIIGRILKKGEDKNVQL